jgi:hypothetical protein
MLSSPLIAATVAMLGSLIWTAIGALILIRRAETSSLFVEDHSGFLVVKAVIGIIMLVAGCIFFSQALHRLVTLSS